jgi:hypothetical protein
MKAGGCSLAPLGTFDGKVPQTALDLVALRQSGIIDSSYVVEINDNEPSAS